jgi:hypothetical protein
LKLTGRPKGGVGSQTELLGQMVDAQVGQQGRPVYILFITLEVLYSMYMYLYRYVITVYLRAAVKAVR